ncbi:MAG: tripartite tricarboxylate transporter TctB family protein [Nitrospinota bacterium]
MKLKDRFFKWLSQRNFNTLLALGLIAFSLFAYLLIPYQIAEPRFMQSRRFTTLTPTMFPRVAAIALLGLSLIYLIGSHRLNEENLLARLAPPSLRRIGVTLFVFILYIYLLEILGFLLATPLCLGILTIYYGNRDWKLLILVIVLVPLAIFYFFQKVLMVALPEGIIFY